MPDDADRALGAKIPGRKEGPPGNGHLITLIAMGAVAAVAATGDGVEKLFGATANRLTFLEETPPAAPTNQPPVAADVSLPGKVTLGEVRLVAPRRRRCWLRVGMRGRSWLARRTARVGHRSRLFVDSQVDSRVVQSVSAPCKRLISQDFPGDWLGDLDSKSPDFPSIISGL